MNVCPEIKPLKNLFHDCGYIYISNIEPAINEPITVRLRTEKGNVTEAYVEISHDGMCWISYEMHLEKEDETGYFEYFIGTIPGQKEMFKYRFRAGNDNPENEVYYSRTYIGKEAPTFDESKSNPDNCWTIIPGYHTPDWAKGIIWYSVMPDAFYNGDITSDEPISGENFSNSWNIPQHTLQYKYGGDLKGIEKKLDYIKELGCEAVFMDPIFKSSQNAGYGPEFYNQIENSFGNRQALADLAKAVHDKGMRYMIDVVLTFVAVRDIWYNKDYTNPMPGAAQDWHSPYHDFFYFNGEEGNTSAYESDWGGVRLNLGNDKLCDLLYRDKNSYLQYYSSSPFDVDAIRFDCGGALSGVKADGTRINDADVMKDIGPYLRAINPEMMLLSEYSHYWSIDKGVWDSRWNLEFVNYAVKYMRGEISESFLFNRFDNEIYNVPRAFAHCQYNSMSDHDRNRISGVEPYAFKAMQLIHMTQIGAPCIYYGDEVRIKRERDRASFYAMEWNEADWDYGVLNDTKALTELRKNYSALRSGIVKYLCIDDENHLMAYARIDETSTVVTIASRNAAAREFAVDVRDSGEVDGTIFTDWFTGKKYIAKNGYIDVTLPAGGTILVKGEASASYKGGFAINYVEDTDATVTVPKEQAFSIEGAGAFVHTDVFNTCEISALCKKSGGTGMLLVCADNTQDCAYIGAKICKDKVTVYARPVSGKKIKKVACKQIAENSYIKITRNASNSFSVYATRTPGWIWEEIVANIHADIPNHAKVGMTSLKGTSVFEYVDVKYDKSSVLCDDFKNGNSAMFDFTPDMNLRYSKAGLTVEPKNGHTELLTNAYDEDWTFQTKLKIKGKEENDYAGVISRQDKEISVIAGRMRQDDRQVFFIGRMTAGKLVVYHTAPDSMPDRNAVVQLQRIGTTYSAIYSYNGKKWHMIGHDVIANMCAERVGLVVNGESSSVFSYASFGNAINDGESYNTPHTPRKIQIDFSHMANTLIQPAYSIVSGEWNYANEGYIQKSKSLAQMGISNKVYSDFKIDGTYVIDDGNGFVGFEFGKKAYNSALGDGILFRFNSDRTVSIVKAGEILAQAAIPDRFGAEVKITIENRHEVLAAFVGQEGEPLLVMNEFEKTSGFVSYFTEGVVGHVNNYLTASYDAEFYFAADYEKIKFTENAAEKCWGHNHCFISPVGIGMTDFVLSGRFKVKHFAEAQNDSFVGFYVCSPEAKFIKDKSISVVFNSNRQLFVKNGHEMLASANLEGEYLDRELMVIKKDGKISVFSDGRKEPLIDSLNVTKNGGVVSLCANKAVVTFENMRIVNLEAKDMLESAANYRKWMMEGDYANVQLL